MKPETGSLKPRQRWATRRKRCLLYAGVLFSLLSLCYGSDDEAKSKPKDLATLKRELATTEARRGTSDPALISILDSIARQLGEQWNFVAAEPAAQRALDIARKAHGEDSIEVVRELDLLGQFYLAQGDAEAALKNYQQALPMVEKKVGKEHPAYGLMLNDLAKSYLAAGKTAEAEEALKKSLATVTSSLGPASGEASEVQMTYGELYLRTGRYGRAESMLVYALTIRSEGLDIPVMAGQMTKKQALFGMAPAQNLLGRLYTVTQLYDQAGKMLQDALKADEDQLGKDHPALEAVLVNLAALSQAQGETDKAVEYQKRADAIHEKKIGIAYRADSPRLKAFESNSPPAPGIHPLASARVGDWVVFSNKNEPAEKKEVTGKTPVVVLVKTSEWNGAEKKWMEGREEMTEISATLKDMFDVAESDWKPETVRIKNADVASLAAVVDQQGQSCKLNVAPDTVPLGGMISMSCGPEVVIQLSDYGHGP